MEFLADLCVACLILSPGLAAAQTFNTALDVLLVCDFKEESLEVRLVGNKINAGKSLLSEATIQSASTSLIMFSNAEKTVFGTINRTTGDLSLTTISEDHKKEMKVGKCQEVGP